MSKTLDVMVQKNWAHGGSSGFARYEFSDRFVDEDGNEYEAGPKSYLEVPTTISGSVVTVPAYPNFPTTESAVLNNGVTVTCHLLDSNRQKKTILFENCRIYTSLPSIISLSQLVLANGASRIQRDTDVWTKEQVIDYVETRPPAQKMTNVIFGAGRLTVAAADPTNPKVVGDNDPRMSAATSSQDGLLASETAEALEDATFLSVANTFVKRDAEKKIDGGGYKVNGTPVVREPAANIANVVTADADATYGTAERDLINELKSKFNLLLAANKAHHQIVAFAPTDLSSLKGWYKALSIAQADNTNVATWPDTSGSAFNATRVASSAVTYQTNELNGQPIVRFNGSGYLTVGTGLSLDAQAVTIFVVKKPVSASVQGVLLGIGTNYPATSTTALGFQQYQSTSTLATPTAVLQPVTPYGHQNFQRWSYLVVRTNASTTRFRINGHQSTSLLAPASGTAQGMNIGAPFDAGGAFFNGDIAEIIIFGGILTDIQVALVEQYLTSPVEYGGAGYSVAPYLVVMDGDSMTRGSGASADLSDNYPSQLAALLPSSYDLINCGVGGQTWANMITDAVTEIDPLLTWRPRTAGVCVAWNTNDIHFGASSDTHIANMRVYCLARRAAGWKVVVGTLLPRSGGTTPADYETKRLTINTYIRANWADFCDGFFDPAADSRIGDLGDETNPTYYADTAHLNGTGYAIVAQLVNTEVVALTDFGD